MFTSINFTTYELVNYLESIDLARLAVDSSKRVSKTGRLYYYYIASAIDQDDHKHRVSIRYFPHIKGHSAKMLEEAKKIRNKWAAEFYNTTDGDVKVKAIVEKEPVVSLPKSALTDMCDTLANKSTSLKANKVLLDKILKALATHNSKTRYGY